MIAFLTQYYRGIGHCMRTKFIAEELAKTKEVLVIDQLFKPPIQYRNCKHECLLEEKPSDLKNIYKYIQNENIVHIRIKKFISLLDKYNIKILISEGFPFCRHQFSYEMFTYFKELKKRDIKIIISVRDFPWDEPHQEQLQDWVNHTQNLVCKYYADKVLVHSDENFLPLYPDRTRLYKPAELLNELKDLVYYTGYVCNSELQVNKPKNNKIIVSTGLNKEEGMLLFKQIVKISYLFSDYEFIMPVANTYIDVKETKTKNNVTIVPFIKDMYKELETCAMYITYGGYNSTMEILKSKVPAIVIPRNDGQKMEQAVRAFILEPYNLFKVCDYYDIKNIHKYIYKALKDLNFPNKNININLNGAKNSVEFIKKHYD